MLEHNELARALTELPDDLLLEEPQAARRKKPPALRRLIAAAAVIAMLAVTVGAVSAGITWNTEKVSRGDVIQRFGAIWEEYYDDSTLGFEKAEYFLPLEAAELPDENRSRIERLVNNYWNRIQQQDGGSTWEEVDFYLQNYQGHYTIPEHPCNSFGSLTDVEDFLGIPLDVPDPLREVIWEGTETCDSMVWVRVYARAAEELGEPKPFKVVISFQLTGYATNGQATGTITVALTEEAAREGMLVESYSYEREGAIWQEEQTIGGYAVKLYGNDPEEGFNGSAGAVYTSGGIGYHISSWRKADIPYYSPGWPYYDSAKELLLSLLADTE